MKHSEDKSRNLKKSSHDINFNISAHNKIAKKYEKLHPDIFNEIEQSRLKNSIKEAMEYVNTKSSILSALDYGCGSGNVTKYLLSLGLQVTAVDISKRFLENLINTFSNNTNLRTLKINGCNLNFLANNVSVL